MVFKNNRKNFLNSILRGRKFKKEFILLVSATSFVASVISTYAFSGKIVEKIEEENQMKLLQKKANEEKARISKLKERYPSINENGLEFAYDSNLIWERLLSYDYSALDGQKVVFLTYDDGPSTTNTPTILNTLEKHNVKATFFITGKTLDDGGKEAEKILKDIYNLGHSIANHSYSHDYNVLYPNRHASKEAIIEDFSKTDKRFKEVLGDEFETKTWRLPGGLMSWKNTDDIKEYANNNNIGLIDWNALNKDAEGRKKNADELYEAAVNTSNGKDMIVLLMHDTYGKEETAKYTDKIIQYYKDNGYVFKTLA